MSLKTRDLVFTSLAASLWLTLALVRFAYDRSLNGWLIGAQASLTAVVLVFRREATQESGGDIRGLAWLSACVPLFALRTGMPSASLAFMQTCGLALTVWALISLSGSFGIAPADRGLVVKGPYKVIRHPAYLGELINFTAAAFTSEWWIWNVLVVIVLSVALGLRLRAEEKIIAGYDAYAHQVPWRFLPRVW